MVHFGNPAGQTLVDQASLVGSGYYQMPRRLKAEKHLDYQRPRYQVEPRTESLFASADQTLTTFEVFQKQNPAEDSVDCSWVWYQTRWWG